MDPNDMNDIDPADAHAAHLAPGTIIEPERDPEAPVAEKAAAPATGLSKQDLDTVRDELRRSNDALAQILSDRLPEKPAVEAGPDPLDELAKDSDPEVKALVARHRELERRMQESDLRYEEEQLARQETDFRTKFNLSDGEVEEIYRRWDVLAQKDPKGWGGLQFGEAVQRIVGFDALVQRRITPGAPAPGPSRAPQPAARPAPTHMLTEPATGVAAPPRQVRPDRNWTTSEAVDAGWDAITRGRR